MKVKAVKYEFLNDYKHTCIVRRSILLFFIVLFWYEECIFGVILINLWFFVGILNNWTFYAYFLLA